MDVVGAVAGGAPGGWGERFRLAALRALRTLIQGVVAAFPSAGAGVAILSTGYWTTFGYACLAALIVAVVSFGQNIASFLPEDPTQVSGATRVEPTHA